MEFKTIFSSSIRNKYKNYICLKYISMNKKINKQMRAILRYLLLINFLIIIFNKNKLYFIEYKNSNKITLKVKESGNRQIFCSNTNSFSPGYYPNKVYINGIQKSVVNHTYYFENKDNIVELEWNNKIDNCFYMFGSCHDINEIDLSNFDSSEVINMEFMFYNCQFLTSINLDNIDTSKVKSMWGMFRLCTKVKYLNLLNFKTSKVENVLNMFSQCSSLTSLDLSNFDTHLITTMDSMFSKCEKLEYINMKNFNEDKLQQTEKMFEEVPNNIVICTDSNNNKILSELERKGCYSINCQDDWITNQKMIIKNTNECIEDCKTNSQYKYEYNNKCYSACPFGKINSNDDKCRCELEQCLSCSAISLQKGLCTGCNVGYYQIEEDFLNKNEIFNCYKENPEGYYLDAINSLYKRCYHTCQRCEIQGNIKNHNCLKCKSEYIFAINMTNYNNCYEKCEYYYYFDEENNYHCTNESTCPNEYPKLIEETNECKIEDSINFNNIIEDILNLRKNETQESKEEETEIYDTIIEKIESILASNNYVLRNIDEGEDQIINTEKILITLTSTENQKNNIYNNNLTTINLGECEILLRNYYNLTSNETIYMKKMEIVQEGIKAKKIEFDIYSKMSGNNLEKLNLTICENTNIYINIPIEINGNIDKFNTSSGYFNDICYTATSDDGTDIILNDRKIEFIEGDNIICQEDCNFSEYDPEIKRVKCECHAKESSSTFADMKINKNKLFENLKDIKNLMNLNILVCYKKLLNINAIFHNIGSLIIIFIFSLHIICIFIFYLTKHNGIFKIIKDLIFVKINHYLIKQNKISINNEIKNKKREIANLKIKTPKKLKRIIQFKKNENRNNKKSIQFKNKSNSNNKIILNNFYIKHNNKIKANIIPQNKIINKNKDFLNLKNKKQNIIQTKKILNFNNDELNELSYDLALIYDKRKYCQYYASLLKGKNSLIFTFCYNEDYNSKIIKIDLFFIQFTINYAINALFFNDETMHKIYANKGSFDLETQIPLTIYSTLISMIFDTPLTFLSLSNDAIINLKQNKTVMDIKKQGNKLNFCLKIKFALYFVISFIFLLFFWYYITMFGVIYKNTQYHLLKDTLMSICLSFLFPFGIYLFPGIFRIPSLSNKKRKRKCLYQFSKILQLW